MGKARKILKLTSRELSTFPTRDADDSERRTRGEQEGDTSDRTGDDGLPQRAREDGNASLVLLLSRGETAGECRLVEGVDASAQISVMLPQENGEGGTEELEAKLDLDGSAEASATGVIASSPPSREESTRLRTVPAEAENIVWMLGGGEDRAIRSGLGNRVPTADATTVTATGS